MKRISSFLYFFVFLVAAQKVYCAAADRRFALYPEEIEGDSLVTAMLIGPGVDDPLSFWEENVARPLRAVNGVAHEVLLGIAEGIKGNILTGTLESMDIRDSVESEIDALAQEGVRIVRPHLPAYLEEILKSDPTLSQEARASISFQLKDQLDLGSPLVVLKSLAHELVRFHTAAAATGAGREHVDSRVYGLMRVATEGAAPSLLIPAAPARWVRKKQRRSLVARLKSELEAAETNVDISNVLFVLVPYMSPASGDGTLEKSICSVCAQEEGDAVALVQNVSECNILPLCLQCVTQLTLKNIVGEMRLEGGIDGAPAALVFGLQVPLCPFCKRAYYDEVSLANLDRALSVSQRKGIVLQALEKELNSIPMVHRATVIGRLIAPIEIYADIITHRNTAHLLSCDIIAVQIFERDARMREGIAIPFSDTAVWKR